MTKKQYSSWNRNRRHSEEVEGHDHFAVILKKGKPALPPDHGGVGYAVDIERRFVLKL